jgi:hypothetical protein
VSLLLVRSQPIERGLPHPREQDGTEDPLCEDDRRSAHPSWLRVIDQHVDAGAGTVSWADPDLTTPRATVIAVHQRPADDAGLPFVAQEDPDRRSGAPLPGDSPGVTPFADLVLLESKVLFHTSRRRSLKSVKARNT